MKLTIGLPIAVLVVVTSFGPLAEAGGRLFRRRPRPVTETATTIRPEDQLAPTPMLGSFRPSDVYVTARQNGMLPGRAGFENSLAFFGPTSLLRSYAAPVSTVVRGYDGIPTVVEGTAFSTPNFPGLSPVVFPSRATNYSALKFQGSPPQIDRATNFIDHN